MMVKVRERARRNARPMVVVMALVITVVLCALVYLVNAVVDGSAFHLASQLAASDARFREILGASEWNLSQGQVYGSLALDSVFAAGVRLRVVVLPVDLVVPAVLAGRARVAVPQARVGTPDPRGRVRPRREPRHRVRPRVDVHGGALPRRRLGARGIDAEHPQVVRGGRRGHRRARQPRERVDAAIGRHRGATHSATRRRPSRSGAGGVLFRRRDPCRRVRRGRCSPCSSVWRPRRSRPHRCGVRGRVRRRCLCIPRRQRRRHECARHRELPRGNRPHRHRERRRVAPVAPSLPAERPRRLRAGADLRARLRPLQRRRHRGDHHHGGLARRPAARQPVPRPESAHAERRVGQVGRGVPGSGAACGCRPPWFSSSRSWCSSPACWSRRTRRRSPASASSWWPVASCWRRWCSSRGRSPARSGSPTRRNAASWRRWPLPVSPSAASWARCSASPRSPSPRSHRGPRRRAARGGGVVLRRPGRHGCRHSAGLVPIGVALGRLRDRAGAHVRVRRHPVVLDAARVPHETARLVRVAAIRYGPRDGRRRVRGSGPTPTFATSDPSS